MFDVVKSLGGTPNYVNPPRRDVVRVGGTGVVLRFKVRIVHRCTCPVDLTPSLSRPITPAHGLFTAILTVRIFFPRHDLEPATNDPANTGHLEAGLALVFAEAPDEVRQGSQSVQPSGSWNQLCPKYAALPPDLQ